MQVLYRTLERLCHAKGVSCLRNLMWRFVPLAASSSINLLLRLMSYMFLLLLLLLLLFLLIYLLVVLLLLLWLLLILFMFLVVFRLLLVIRNICTPVYIRPSFRFQELLLFITWIIASKHMLLWNLVQLNTLSLKLYLLLVHTIVSAHFVN